MTRPLAGSPSRLSTHPGRFLAVLLPASRSALTSNPHSPRCAAGALLPATSCLGAFWTPGSCAYLEPRYCWRPTCERAAVRLRRATHLIPDKGQFRKRFHHPLSYCCPATIFRDILTALFWPAPSG